MPKKKSDIPLREQILKEAKKHLDLFGSEDFSLREVARRIGVTHVATYRHFKNREALLAELARVDFEKLKNSIIEASVAHPDQPLEACGIAYVVFAMRHPHRFRSMFSMLREAERHPKLQESARATFAEVERLSGLEQAKKKTKKGDVAALSVAAWAIAHGMACLLLDSALPPDLAEDPWRLAMQATSILKNA